MIKIEIVLFLFSILSFPSICHSQGSFTEAPGFQVNRVYPSILITKEALQKANSLSDLNPHYKSSWVRKFVSVEILTSYHGELSSAASKDSILTQEQKDNMERADVGTAISVHIQYIPANTLSNNDVKEINYLFTPDPDKEARFVGGYQALELYLKEKAISKIPNGLFKGFDLTAVKFTVNELGEITDVQVFEGSGDESVDLLLLETVQNMPCWESAEYFNGLSVKQEFVLTVGNMENCMVNLLNINRGLVEKQH